MTVSYYFDWIYKTLTYDVKLRCLSKCFTCTFVLNIYLMVYNVIVTHQNKEKIYSSVFPLTRFSTDIIKSHVHQP